MFHKAEKKGAFLRLALYGPSGSGKSYTALSLATSIRPDAKVAAIDTERGSLSKYADLFDFDVLELDSFEPARYVSAIEAATSAGYTCLVIDSLSHAWSGVGGLLEQVDNAAKRSKSGNSFMAWRDATPQHNKLVDAILRAGLDVIVTMRSKTEYIIEENERGRKQPRKVGLAPVQRDGVEYEFDVVLDMEEETALVSKTRCPSLAGKTCHHPGKEVANLLAEWLGEAPQPNTAPEVQRVDAEFRAACEQAGLDTRAEAKALQEKHQAKSWTAVLDTQKRHRIQEIEAAGHVEFPTDGDGEGEAA